MIWIKKSSILSIKKNKVGREGKGKKERLKKKKRERKWGTQKK